MGTRIKNRFLKYFKLLKIQLYPFFLEVVIGVFFATSFELERINFLQLFFFFLSFQSIYSSIYINNDLFDVKRDREDPVKSKRPIASGDISIRNVIILSVALLLAGLISAFYLSLTLFAFEVVFFIYNIFYSTLLKKIPYLESYANGVTHALRFIMGSALYGGIVYPLLTMMFFLFASSIAFSKKSKEIHNFEMSRKVLKHYTIKAIETNQFAIGLFMIFFLTFSNSINERLIMSAITIFYLITFFVYFRHEKIRAKIHKIYNY